MEDKFHKASEMSQAWFRAVDELLPAAWQRTTLPATVRVRPEPPENVPFNLVLYHITGPRSDQIELLIGNKTEAIAKVRPSAVDPLSKKAKAFVSEAEPTAKFESSLLVNTNRPVDAPVLDALVNLIYDVGAAADCIPKFQLIDENFFGLRIAWSKKDLYLDIFPATAFQEEVEGEKLVHLVATPASSDRPYCVIADLTVRSREAVLVYEDQGPHCTAGTLTIQFSDSTRRIVQQVLWDGKPSGTDVLWSWYDETEGPGTPEGAVKIEEHKSRERDPSRRRDKLALASKPLICEGCALNFEACFGELSERMAEVHHTKPVKDKAPEGELTPLNELAILCPMCHRFIHKFEELPTIKVFRDKLPYEIKRKGQAV